MAPIQNNQVYRIGDVVPWGTLHYEGEAVDLIAWGEVVDECSPLLASPRVPRGTGIVFELLKNGVLVAYNGRFGDEPNWDDLLTVVWLRKHP